MGEITKELVQIEMTFSPEDGAGGILFYVSPVPVGKGDNYGAEEKFPMRLALEELDNPPLFCLFKSGKAIDLTDLIQEYEGWYCNVSASWDSDGVSAL